MRYFLFFFSLYFIFAIFLVSPSYAASPTFSLSPSEGSYSIDERFTIDIKGGTGGNPVRVFGIYLTYDYNSSDPDLIPYGTTLSNPISGFSIAANSITVTN